MMFIEVELENRINQLKKELIQVTKVTGLNSHDTLCCSQKLDELIAIYQKYLQGSQAGKIGELANVVENSLKSQLSHL